MLVNTDPPKHEVERKLVSQAFSPRRVKRLEGWLDELVPRLLDDLGVGDVEVMEFAAEIPTRAMVRLLGLPDGDHVRFKKWANAFMLSSSLTPEERIASNEEMVMTFATRLAEHTARLAERTPTDDVEDAEDLISALLRAAVDGQRLTPEEIVRFCVTLVVAGSETTTFLIGNLLHAMAREPEITARMRDDRTLVNVFVEEAMRVDGPPQRLFRIATRDVEVGGKLIRKGDWVALFFGSANRDPEVFEDPDKFDIDRPNIRQQLSMGHGLHFCLGRVAGPPGSRGRDQRRTRSVSDDRTHRRPRHQADRQPADPRVCPSPPSPVMTPNEAANIAATKAIYAAVPAGDLQTALDLLDPDVRITYYGTDGIPYAGDYRGFDEAVTFFTRVGESIAITEMEAWKFIAQGDELASWGRQRFRRLDTGYEWESEFAHIITLRGGRWLYFRDFMNSALTLQAFTR